jgi:hypothetical protein
MNTKISLSIKTFFCITAFVLTSTHSFANSVEKNSLKYDYYKLKSAPQPHKLIAPTALTLSYDVATFCAGVQGISTPKVSEAGGNFKYERVSNGTGALAFNAVTGLIDHSISDAGTYKMIYIKNTTSASIIITVKECK